MKNILFIVIIIITFTACGDEEKRKQELIDQEVKNGFRKLSQQAYKGMYDSTFGLRQ